MFEVGKSYWVTMLEGSAEAEGPVDVSTTYEVVAIDGTIVHFRSPDLSQSKFAEFVAEGLDKREDVFINTASLYFVSAKPLPSRKED